MGRITALFARKVAAAAAGEVDPAESLRTVGLAPEADHDVREMLDADAYYSFLEATARRMACGAALPILVGSSMRCDDYGAFGLAWKTAPTLRGSFARAERYGRLLTSVSEYELASEPGGAFCRLRRDGDRRLGLRLSNEASLASIVAIAREVSVDRFSPIEVRLKHPRPADTRAHAAFFQCPVRFSTDDDGLLIATDDLAAPNRLGDEGVTRFLLDHLDAELAAIPNASSLDAQVREAIARSLSDGPPKMAEVARALGMSERTLHRRLAEDGRRFQDLAVEARRGAAERLLKRTDYALAEIAFLCGFSDQSAFTRAFRRWAGRTPADYRARA